MGGELGFVRKFLDGAGNLIVLPTFTVVCATLAVNTVRCFFVPRGKVIG